MNICRTSIPVRPVAAFFSSTWKLSNHNMCSLRVLINQRFYTSMTVYCAFFNRVTIFHRIERPHKYFRKARSGSVSVYRTLASSDDAFNRSNVLNKKGFVASKDAKPNILSDVLRERKQRFKESGQIILQDIRETKNKMKERMEEVIERENVLTIPNFLCVSRILVSPYLGYVITQSNFQLAFGLFVFAGITDLIDGWIARSYPSQATKIGSFLDPMADKVLVAILFVSLTYMDLIPLLLTSMIIIRDLLLVIAGFYIRYQSLPPPKTISRYFDVTHATAQLAPTFVSKVNTAVQLTLAATTLAAPVFGCISSEFIQGLWYLTGATTIASACSYIFSRNTYKYLKPKKKDK